MRASGRIFARQSARANRGNADDRTNFSRAVPRRLGAEQILDSIVQITGVRENYRNRVNAASVSMPSTGLRAALTPCTRKSSTGCATPLTLRMSPGKLSTDL